MKSSTTSSYHRGCQCKARCRIPRSGTDLLAFENCITASAHHVAPISLPMAAHHWILHFELSSPLHYLCLFPKDMKSRGTPQQYCIVSCLFMYYIKLQISHFWFSRLTVKHIVDTLNQPLYYYKKKPPSKKKKNISIKVIQNTSIIIIEHHGLHRSRSIFTAWEIMHRPRISTSVQ